jgi:SAM-dependent methyltransferase
MSAFADPRATWSERFDREDYLFGEAPNAFLAREVHRFAPGSTALAVADGEGRNSVHLARAGVRVTAFDFAATGVAKARRLAARHGVVVDFHVADIHDWPWHARTYDAVVAIFIQFLAPDEREAVFAGMRAAVSPGGLFVLEGYRPEQVDLGTGGPGRRDHMYTEAWLAGGFAGWDILHLAAYDAELAEGSAHAGRSALIDLVARRK